MITQLAKKVACLIPIAILVHQLEEYFGHFPLWYSNLLNAQLSNKDFIIINGIGLFVFTFFSLSYLFNKKNLVLAALGSFIFFNGIIHVLLSIFTLSYSPGTISGIVLFIPLGIIVFKQVFPFLYNDEKIAAIAIGILVLSAVSVIAKNI